MARTSTEERSYNLGYTTLEGAFKPAGTGAPTNVTGRGFTVARQSAGLFRVTFKEAFNAYLVPWAQYRAGTGITLYAQVGAISIANKTMDIRLWNGTAETDASAGTDNEVNFSIKINNQRIK